MADNFEIKLDIKIVYTSNRLWGFILPLEFDRSFGNTVDNIRVMGIWISNLKGMCIVRIVLHVLQLTSHFTGPT